MPTSNGSSPSNTSLTDEELDRLRRGDHPHLYLKRRSLTDADATVLADVLRESPGVVTLDISENKMSLDGIVKILNAVNGMHSLEQLKIWGNEELEVYQRPILLTKLTEVIPTLPNLTTLSPGLKIGSYYNVLGEACLTSCHKNLIAAPDRSDVDITMGSTIKDVLKQNKELADRYGALITTDGLQNQTLQVLLDIEQRMPAIIEVARDTRSRSEDKVKTKQREFYGTLPQGAPRLEALTQRDPKTGKCALDNPMVWEKMPELIRKAAEEGNHIRPEDLMVKNPEGCCYLSIGIGFSPLHILGAFSDQGDHISAEILQQDLDTPQPMVKTLSECRALRKVFTEDVWMGIHPSEIRRTLSAIPPEERKQIDVFTLVENCHTAYYANRGLGR